MVREPHYKGHEVQSHGLQLLCWSSTCTSGRVGKIQEGWKGQMIQWMDTNNVGEIIPDTCGYKTLTHCDTVTV